MQVEFLTFKSSFPSYLFNQVTPNVFSKFRKIYKI